MAVTGAATISCWIRMLSSATYSPSHCQAGNPMMNIQPTPGTAPDLCENVSLSVLFSSNGNSYTYNLLQYLGSEICMYMYIQGVPGGMCQTSGECSLG